MEKQSGASSTDSWLSWTRQGWICQSQVDHWRKRGLEHLIFRAELRNAIQKAALGFLGSADLYKNAHLTWKKGWFVYGPEGCGKTTLAAALSLVMECPLLFIASHEINDATHFQQALTAATAFSQAVVVLDGVDEIFKRVDADVFFQVFDRVSALGHGLFWMATTRHPELVSKSRLIRPGRFDEVFRVTPPSSVEKIEYYEKYFAPFLLDVGPAKQTILDALCDNSNLTFAHLEQLRYLLLNLLIKEGGQSSEAMEKIIAQMLVAVQSFLQEVLLDNVPNQPGQSLTATHQELRERVLHSDPRLLLSAFEVTDAFKRIVDATVTNVLETKTNGESHRE